MTNATKGKICKISAVVIDVAVPLIATIMHFPIWVERSSRATVSGLFLIFAFHWAFTQPMGNYLGLILVIVSAVRELSHLKIPDLVLFL